MLSPPAICMVESVPDPALVQLVLQSIELKFRVLKIEVSGFNPEWLECLAGVAEMLTNRLKIAGHCIAGEVRVKDPCKRPAL